MKIRFVLSGQSDFLPSRRLCMRVARTVSDGFPQVWIGVDLDEPDIVKVQVIRFRSWLVPLVIGSV